MPNFRFVNCLTARIFHLLRDRKANVAVMFAVMMVPTIYLLGMTLDYTQAVRKRSQLERSARRGRHCRRHAEHAVAEQRCRDYRRNQRLQRHGNRSSRPFRPHRH